MSLGRHDHVVHPTFDLGDGLPRAPAATQSIAQHGSIARRVPQQRHHWVDESGSHYFTALARARRFPVDEHFDDSEFGSDMVSSLFALCDESGHLCAAIVVEHATPERALDERTYGRKEGL